MKKLESKLTLLIILSLIVPNIVFAAWWNPMSWGWFEKILKRNPKVEVEEVLKESDSSETDKFEELNKKIEELEKKLTEEKKEEPQTKPVSSAVKAPVSTQIVVPPSSPVTNSSSLSNQELISLVKPAVVYISTESGSGSGFIFDSSGYILTNAHVVEGSSNVEVMFSNKRRLSANVVGINNLTSDIAVLKLDSGGYFPTIKLGNSNATLQGEDVFAFGYPLSGTIQSIGATADEVSFKEGTVSRRTFLEGVPYLEMSAEIHSGNSGGPLINGRGEVVGVNTVAVGTVGDRVKWAIEINHVKAELNDLKAGKQLIKNKTQNTIEFAVRSTLTGLNTKISTDPEISKAILNAYIESTFSYYEKQILTGVVNGNESQESLRKSYLSAISSGYKVIVTGMEDFKKLIESFNDFYITYQFDFGSISNSFARNKLVEFGNHMTSKVTEYDKRIASIYTKISAIDDVLKKGNLKELPISYFIQQRDDFKIEINYISAQKDDIADRSWIKALY